MPEQFVNEQLIFGNPEPGIESQAIVPDNIVADAYAPHASLKQTPAEIFFRRNDPRLPAIVLPGHVIPVIRELKHIQRILFRLFDHSLQRVGVEPVVSVKERQPLAAGLVQTQVAGTADASVGLVKRTDAGILCSKRVTNQVASVRTAVIDEYELPV